MSFSENLKIIRAEKNLSQEQLAELVGVSRQAYSPDKKISIQAFDGKTMSAFYKFTINKMLFPRKDEPKCFLVGIDSSNFLGEHQVLLGWYATNVKLKLFSAKIVND